MPLFPWIDATAPLSEATPVWPGDPPVKLWRILDTDRGDASNLSYLQTCVHAGTHVDAPRHYLPAGPGIEALPIEAMVGPARVLDVGGPEVSAAEVEAITVLPGERLLLRTPPEHDAAWLSVGAAQVLAGRGVLLVGIDRPSVGAFDASGDDVHRILLGAGAWIVEGLVLTECPPGPCELLCLPLRIPGADGAPARVLVRPLLP